ncbi:glutamyl-tRNA synthetase [Burkholderiales bacterium GJ-E10]|nr:glutamyl-tRNA synthetase [Burkholderiales bacterium GJ-E10]
MTSTVRTRIAPSPTGMLHLGTARTALFSWAFARHHGGAFILRIEDTDLERSTEEAVQVILDSMKWLGLEYDEGPFRQTDRLPRYREVIERLLAEGKAYRCYATREELDALRADQTARGEKPRYDGRWRPERAQGRTPPDGVAPVIRFRTPDTGEVWWNDLVKGPIHIANAELDDLVIARGDGVPTYNFAVVVDDIDMEITHVLRGDDHVNNTPRQINIYRAILGEDAALPRFGHLSMILGPDGQKLSKRHGAVSVLQYEEDGFLPEALFNYLARLGWSHGDAEKFGREELVQWFDLEHVNRAPAQYDINKLLWLNGEYLKEADDQRLASLTAPRLRTHGIDAGHPGGGPQLDAVVALYKGRVRTLNELADEAMLFYRDPQVHADLLREHVQGPARDALQAFARAAEDAGSWGRAAISEQIKRVLGEFGLKMPQFAIPLRVAVSGRTQTPSIDAVLELLGREATVRRVRAALAA